MIKLKQYYSRAKKLLEFNKQIVIQNLERRRGLSGHQGSWDSFPEDVLGLSEPVFFLSTGRCGTELLTQILEKDKSSLVHHSPVPELLYVDKWAFENKGETEQIKAAFLSGRFELLSDAYLRNRKYVETNFRTTFFAQAVAELLPKAKFVHVVRSPVKFIESAVRLNFYGGSYTDIGRIAPLNMESKHWHSFTQAEKSAWLWNTTNEYIESFKLSISTDRVLTVYSEELFSNIDEIKRVLNFCQLAMPTDIELKSSIAVPVNQKKHHSGSKSRALNDGNKKSLLPLLNAIDKFEGLSRYAADLK